MNLKKKALKKDRANEIRNWECQCSFGIAVQ